MVVLFGISDWPVFAVAVFSSFVFGFLSDGVFDVGEGKSVLLLPLFSLLLKRYNIIF